MTNPDQDARDFLQGGGGAKSIFNKYDAIGTVRRITIDSWKMQQQRDPKDQSLKTWKDGNAMMQLVIVGSNFRDQADTPIRDNTGEQADTGERRAFVKGDLKAKVSDALRAAGETFIARGGILTVARVDKEPDQGVIDGAWIHQCHYQPPAQSFLASPSTAPAAAAAPLNLAPASLAPAAAPVAAAAPLNLAPASLAPAAAPVAAPVPDATAVAAANLAAAGMVATSPAVTAPPAASPPAASTAPPVAAAAAPPGVDPALAAALANLTTEQRQAMGLPA